MRKTNNNIKKNRMVFDKSSQENLDKLVEDGLMVMEIKSGKRIYHLTEKGIDYIMKKVDERESD